MKKILLFISLFLGIACSSSSSDEGNNPMVVDIAYILMYTDAVGNDLLDPSFKGSFAHHDVNLYAVDEKGDKSYAVIGKGTDLIKTSVVDGKSVYYIDVKHLAFYISLPNGDVDKVTTVLKPNTSSLIKDKIYYNDKLVWSAGDKNDRVIIIKN